jgi:hypothetical protein
MPTLKGLLAASPLLILAAVALNFVEGSSKLAGFLASLALLVLLLVWLYIEGTRK